MDLDTFMREEGLTNAALAKQLSKSGVTIGRYRRKVELPPSKVVKQLVEISGGRMTADELLGIGEGS